MKMERFYLSEFDQFLNQLKLGHPDIPEQQEKGRALQWDKLPAAPDGRPWFVAEPFTREGYVYYENPPRRTLNIPRGTRV
ncbi:Conserved hypothetical protein [Paraburkholderia xenovorans LB400]|uniref:DUF3460 family protein n=2 Tax=Paraburkholderia xenovorans TaxID=36873 RepID=Q13ZU4_PARXL|nr:Conserved hypothetical protein [Paraburkholderia xenovorans LB400]